MRLRGIVDDRIAVDSMWRIDLDEGGFLSRQTKNVFHKSFFWVLFRLVFFSVYYYIE